MVCKGINVDKCRVMNSKKRPLWLNFVNSKEGGKPHVVLFKSGDTEKAIELSEESLDLMKSAIAFDHILVSKVLKNIGDYYQDIQAYDEATEAYNESLRVMTSFYGQDHVLLSEVLNEIGVTRFKSGDYPVAKQSFTEVSYIAVSVFSIRIDQHLIICSYFCFS